MCVGGGVYFMSRSGITDQWQKKGFLKTWGKSICYPQEKIELYITILHKNEFQVKKNTGAKQNDKSN